MDAALQKQYQIHLDTLAPQWAGALQAEGFDAVMVAAGASRNYLFDDQGPVFRPNPHFALWFPHEHSENGILIYEPGKRPRLFFHQPSDYWYLPQQAPEWAQAHFHLTTHRSTESLARAARTEAGRLGRVAWIGEAAGCADFPTNPPGLIDRLHYQRACKSDFEIACMRLATQAGVAGHVAARDAFRRGAGERDILRAYLAASGHTEAELPYPCIIAQNEHAAVLHYQHYDAAPPERLHSFLIDAGAQRHGYACDITRTHAADERSVFGSLIKALDGAQQALIETIEPGVGYLDLHVGMHRRLSELLAEFDLVKCGPEAAFELGISQTFLPHGLGHLLGLQVHDVAGHQVSASGEESLPPAEYGALRLTRRVEPRMVFTVEPGLYFIPMLLGALRDSPAGAEVNWSAVEALLPCGGIRVEDNVLVTATGASNLTREAFAAVESS